MVARHLAAPGAVSTMAAWGARIPEPAGWWRALTVRLGSPAPGRHAAPETADAPESVTCPRCGCTSHHPTDVREQYCGRCHAFHEDSELVSSLLALADEMLRPWMAGQPFVREEQMLVHATFQPAERAQAWRGRLAALREAFEQTGPPR